MNKYNYIVVCKNHEIYNYFFRDLNSTDYAYYDNMFPYKRLEKKLYKFSFSKIINSILPFSGKRIWFNKRIGMYKKIANNFANPSLPLCFVLLPDCYSLERFELIARLRSEFPNCKILYYFTDLVSKADEKQKIIEKRDMVDGIITYDANDAKKYDLFLYDGLIYSKPDVVPQEHMFDVCFVGKAKDRLDRIMNAYDYFIKNGLKCDFHIVAVPEEKRRKEGGIDYCKSMSYSNYLQVISKSKCILEIPQQGANSKTLRTCEAIFLNKYFISNHGSFICDHFFDNRYMQVYENVDEIDIQKIRRCNEINYAESLKEELSPINFLKFIDTLAI